MKKSDELLVLRLVDVLTDEPHHVGRTTDAGQSRFEDELRHPRSRLDLDLEDVRLQWVHEALLEQLRRLLIRHCLRGLDEQLVGGSFCLCCEDRQTNRREDVEV